jgi:hypothetical protein
LDSKYDKALILQSNVDADNNPFIPIIPQVERVPKSLTIITTQTINEEGGVEILFPSNLIETDDVEDLNNYDNRYLVLSDKGQIKFSKNLEGQYIYFNHCGESAIYMSSYRIWTVQDSNGNIIGTLQGDMDLIQNALELYKTAGDLRKLATDMDVSVENGQTMSSSLNTSVVIANQTNDKINTSTNNAKAEDIIVNKTIDTAKATDKTLNDTNTTANNTNDTLNITIGVGNQLNTDLTALNTTALETKTNLDTSNATALATKSALDTSNDTANSTKSALDTSNSNATSTKTALDTLNTTATTTKTDLTTINNTATQTKTDLTTINDTATTTKTDLTSINTTAINTKSTLQSTIDSANQANTNLDITGMKDNINGIMGGTKDITYNDTTTVSKTVKGAINELNPAGEVTNFAMTNPPVGWLKCNGALVSRTTYARLFTAIGVVFGAGDSSTTFALPNITAPATGLISCIRY